MQKHVLTPPWSRDETHRLWGPTPKTNNHNYPKVSRSEQLFKRDICALRNQSSFKDAARHHTNHAFLCILALGSELSRNVWTAKISTYVHAVFVCMLVLCLIWRGMYVTNTQSMSLLPQLIYMMESTVNLLHYYLLCDFFIGAFSFAVLLKFIYVST